MPERALAHVTLPVSLIALEHQTARSAAQTASQLQKEKLIMADRPVLVERAGSVGIITLNRPEALNALSSSLRGSLSESVTTLDSDPAIKVIVLTGSGRAFSAGLDLKELSADPSAMSKIVSRDVAENPMCAMDRCTKPIIGAVNGVAITGGFELALGCDVLIASSSARFADTHVRVGALPGWGLSQRLSRSIGLARAKEMSLTARIVEAREALDWGLVNAVVEPDQLLPKALEVAEQMAAAATDMLQKYKGLIDRGAALPLGEALLMEQQAAQRASASFEGVALDGSLGARHRAAG
ncbi:enoyl-CoA hydratase [Sphingomonas oryzagri]